MTEQTYISRMIELVSANYNVINSLEEIILWAHQTIEAENNIFLNLSHEDIGTIKQRVLN